MDDPLEVRLHGLEPGVSVRIRASLKDDHNLTWQSEATFVADKTGVVDVATAIPIDGAWAEPDPYGLLWSMRPITGQLTYDGALTGSLRPLVVTLTALLNGEAAAQIQLERRFTAEGVRCSEWRDKDLVANLFLPAGDGPWDATLVLDGAAGGFIWANEVAALLASRGRAALAIAYFDWRGRYGLPTSITEIPLEYFRGAIERLQAHPQVRLEDLAAVGISKGAELVLLLASTYPQIRRVVAQGPSSYVWEAVRMDATATRSAWTLDQRPLPYATFAADDEFYRTLDKTLLLPFHERALRNPEALLPARIRVENIEAQTLLVSIAKDTLWPSTLMGEQIVKTLHEAGKARLVTHLVIECRHHALCPPGLPTNSIDDDPAVNARGELQSWTATLAYLGLKPPSTVRMPK
ncbi:MAG: acyl-CoA thioesterase/BAAT N-terminal domain-containing protein [Egibacteraceae bacterium]